MGTSKSPRFLVDLPGPAQSTMLLVGTVLIFFGALPVFLSGTADDVTSVIFLAIVLWVGVLGGTAAGAVAAVAAIIGYVVLRSGDPSVGSAAAVRGVAFLTVGLGSGYLVSRLRRLLEGTRPGGPHDAETGAFSSTYMQQLLLLQVEEHLRYQKPFSLLIISTPPAKSKRAAATIQEQIRTSDTLGRSKSNGLLVILAHTDWETARVASSRIESALGPESGVTVTILSAPGDLEEITKLSR